MCVIVIGKRVNEILNEIASVSDTHKEREETPNDTMEELLSRVSRKTKRALQKGITTLNDLFYALDYLRVKIKYLIFDLEATRRENVQLKKELDDRKR